MKVKLFDKQIIIWFYRLLSVISVITSIVFLFVDIEQKYKAIIGIVVCAIFTLIYLGIWIYANKRNSITLTINNSTIEIKYGDLFIEESDWKAIAFNEYFDTIVDNKIIAQSTLNGMYINRFFADKIDLLDKAIESDSHLSTKVICQNQQRPRGKITKYKLGSVCVVKDYLLTALTHFDEDNKAYIDMDEYITFLLSFWEEVDRIYAGKTIAVPVFGSGITRFKKYDIVSDQELLELIIWSFKVSRIKFPYPSKVKIVVYDGKRDKINLQELKSFQE
ncbi:hypothetical protein FXB42_11955 [Acetobacterium wieringae]|uniref:EF-hand domain-containing protein n=1 Tax=Acetobacterium wieringae TaxID=52694 RepID=A0A5D0WJJ3_9FIRM|nr:macro domain-containing protein [Acetobacterium wieringae]TYC84475.1 hypothetical protein FXB42_11955 [Acetobacterium wieringae]